MTAPLPEADGAVLPAYGRAWIGDLLPSLAAGMSVPGFADTLGLGPAERAAVLLVDGLGLDLLREHADAAPFLAAAAEASRWRTLTAGFPSTTASSLGSLGTGLPPGEHGLVGYTFALPGQQHVLNCLRWDPAADPYEVQPLPTLFERLAEAGVAVGHLGPRAFAGTGLTTAVLRGARYPGAETAGELVGGIARELAAAPRVLLYLYYGNLDRVGHSRGCRSLDWRAQLTHVDLLARQVAEVLPPGAVLHVTADHGMVDASTESKIDVEADPVLREGVRLLGGEPRARHVYARPGAAADVLAAWTQVLGDRAWVLSREQAVEAGWFGRQVTDRVLPRVGDVVAAARGTVALVAPHSQPMESALVGYHGSLTRAEMLVPLVTARG